MSNRSKVIIILIFIVAAGALKEQSGLTALKVKFPKPLRINEINWFEIEVPDTSVDSAPGFRLASGISKDSIYLIDENLVTFKSYHIKNKKRIIGYFFLPNILPVGGIEITAGFNNLKSETIKATLQPEVIYRTPIYIKGWPVLSHSAEVGMKFIKAESYPESEIGFQNPHKKCFLFFRVGLIPPQNNILKTKMKIFIKQFLLDEIELTNEPKKYIYCLSEKLTGKIDWLIIKFETTNNENKIKGKVPVAVFDYIRLVPEGALPDWAERFIQPSDKIPKEWHCR